jgi:hypothetical protein
VIGELLLHPVALASVAVLLVNDHWGKARFPGVITGKLSDLAGLVFFPLLLTTVIDAAARVFGRRTGPSQGTLLVGIVLTGAAFAGAKATAVGAEAYRTVWGVLEWPLRAALAGHLVPWERAAFVRDPTDLVALPALVISWLVGRRMLGYSGLIAVQWRGTVARPW